MSARRIKKRTQQKLGRGFCHSSERGPAEKQITHHADWYRGGRIRLLTCHRRFTVHYGVWRPTLWVPKKGVVHNLTNGFRHIRA